MLAGSVTFLVSLYFEWIHAALCLSPSVCIADHPPGLINSGWSSSGEIAALLAVALAAGAIAAIVDQELATRLPVGRIAVALGIFALLSVSEIWVSAVAENGFPGGYHTIGLGPAAYIGLASVGVACAGAAAARWGQIPRPPRVTAAVGQLLTLTLIASFVLPALNASERSAYDFMLQFQDAGTLICAFACLGLLAWRGQRPGPRLATAAAIGTLVAVQLLPLRHDYAQWPYELWLLLACAAGLLVLGLACSSGLRLRRPTVSELAIVAGSVLLLVSLFLPWESIRDGGNSFSQDGWSTTKLAGAFALGLLLALVWAGRFVRELAIGAAIYVLSAGLVTATASAMVLRPGEKFGVGFVYGAPLGFAGAAVLLVFGLGRFRPLPDKRFLLRLVPVLAALALLSFEVAPNVANLGDILGKTNLFAIQSPFLQLGFLDATAILLTLRLLLRWFDRPREYAEAVLLPLALLALTALALIQNGTTPTTIPILAFVYGKGVSWEGWVAVFLGLLLVACGWVEPSDGGLRSFRIPKEIWRGDPLPPVED